MRPHSLQNPGGFDYEAHLFRNRLRATGYVRLDDTSQRLEGPTPARYTIDRVRQRLGEVMRARLGDNPFAGIVVALANGDSGGVGNAQWDIFRRTGTLPLVAISGLHISLIGGIAFFLGRWLWALPGYTVLRYPAPVVGAVCALFAAAGYAALAGFVIPTQRALIMLGVVMGGILLRCQVAPTQLLAIALFAVLAYDPLAVMAAGFWLSFAAVAVILFVAHGGSRRMEWWRKWGYLQIAIVLGMLPLMFALFQQASLVAPLANLLAVPVLDLLMVPLVLAGLAFLGFLPADIEAKAERRLLAEQGAWLRADILVAPHHGSKTSSTAAFIDAVRPDIVLFPVGYRNRFHHPHPTVVARYDEARASFRLGVRRRPRAAVARGRGVGERLARAPSALLAPARGRLMR